MLKSLTILLFSLLVPLKAFAECQTSLIFDTNLIDVTQVAYIEYSNFQQVVKILFTSGEIKTIPVINEREVRDILLRVSQAKYKLANDPKCRDLVNQAIKATHYK